MQLHMVGNGPVRATSCDVLMHWRLSGCLGDSGCPRVCRNTKDSKDAPPSKRLKPFSGPGHRLGGAVAASDSVAVAASEPLAIVSEQTSDGSPPELQQGASANHHESLDWLFGDRAEDTNTADERVGQIQKCEESVSDGWICAACTFVNGNLDAPVCEICQTKR